MEDSVSTKISEVAGNQIWPCRLPPAQSWSSKVAETRWLGRRPKARWRWPWGEPKAKVIIEKTMTIALTVNQNSLLAPLDTLILLGCSKTGWCIAREYFWCTIISVIFHRYSFGAWTPTVTTVKTVTYKWADFSSYKNSNNPTSDVLDRSLMRPQLPK